MQTFLPYPDFAESFKVLDSKRLGNQVYREALTLIKGGWPNHPAAKMWLGHTRALALYALAGLDELFFRGKDYSQHRTTFETYRDLAPDTGLPWWFGNEDFHVSHRSNLLRKNAEHYGPLFGSIPDDLLYLWPDNQTKTFRTIAEKKVKIKVT